ncbi:hypothetical protein G8V03_09535 [Clostridium botulinum D/C]|uniref:hypothetical protein n=1 Tax=Clostridium botulinum TaxID=1491 RepID=UPI001E3CAD94|nr:hypothetical protein [Clostridium botulinum]MCD3351229.1 hypothetical protein [Clostridium botulinum D/C]MCD3360186.1 hypothetical protein [Clostridium botulinum D/C]MCD3361711.1 hypothetical protein [Clostridium botulinum D/C]MCD3365991.1 hypothetical protein [Clostridium botulinum D/C]
MEELNINEVINQAVSIAIKKFDKEKKEKQRDKRLHNTRLLMKHYNTLWEHVDNVNTDDKLLDYLEEEEEEVTNRTFIISVCRTKMRTAKMLGLVDSALRIVKDKFEKNSEKYKYKAFELYYFEKMTNEEIQKELNCGKNSPKKWSDLVIEELSLLLWGIEALGM